MSRACIRVAAVCGLLFAAASTARAEFMDLTTITSGGPTVGGFTGTLLGAAVTGSLTVPAGGTTGINVVAPGIGFSTIDNTSPQWSHPTAYAPTAAIADRVGFSAVPGSSARVVVSFSAPMTNLVFHVANLDESFMDYTPSIGSGLTGMVLLNGNGGGGDGITVSAPIIADATPGTADGTPPGTAPPMAGPRSAYGSILMTGTYTTLSFDIITPGGIENANFTFSAVPEPTSLVLMGLATAGMGVAGWRRKRRVVSKQ